MEKSQNITRHFITVEYCGDGNRGIFCTRMGSPAVQDEAFTDKEMQGFCGAFFLILSPRSEEMDQETLSKYTHWYPLKEYQDEWGIALKEVPGYGNQEDD